MKTSIQCASSKSSDTFFSGILNTIIRVIAALNNWMKAHPYDFDESEVAFLKEVEIFINRKLPPSMKSTTEQLNRALTAAAETNQARAASNVLNPLSSSGGPELDFMTLDMNVLAEVTDREFTHGRLTWNSCSNLHCLNSSISGLYDPVNYSTRIGAGSTRIRSHPISYG